MQDTLIDFQQRQQALDVRRSFLVQAPAGSGKTGLLIQRFLALLLTVDKYPEECLAITFTRKAASEMRERIVDALLAAKDPEPTESYRLQTWQLAKQVLKKDQNLQWCLIENPQRLRILTFDAFCASLTRRMPVMANFGFQPQIRENAKELYEMAVIRLLQQPKRMAEIAGNYEVVLKHLDNNKILLKKLLIELLGQREQWLRPVVRTQQDLNKEQLETGLASVVRHYLRQAEALVFDCELPNIADFAAKNIENPLSPLCACEGMQAWPKGDVEDLPQWRGLAELCFTSDNQLRKKLTIKQGFPPATKGVTKEQKAFYKAQKERAEALLEMLHGHPDLVQAMQRIKTLPPLSYQSQQWQVLAGLAQILLYAVAELALVFQETGEVDFTEISIAASRSLGEMDAPSDLALALDYRIRHILVDEFQDTSIAQFALLKLLTAGWEVEDGRTLFLVGDPMQSIYRFRQAEVGLFLAVKKQGVGELPIHFIQLQANFRSEPPIVSWVNQIFNQCFPQVEDLSLGAIPYSASEPVKKECTGQVDVKVCESSEGGWEAKQIVHAIQAFKTKCPMGTCAILVRSRTHLLTIIPKLKEAAIQFQGVDIELLANKPEIQDLFALTRAMTHWADRTAWLAVLRAPWCGLTLMELTQLCEKAGNAPLWLILEDFRFHESEEATLRLQNFVQIIKYAFNGRAGYDFATWLYQLWLSLDGPRCYDGLSVMANAEVYFQLLNSLSEGQLYQTEVLKEKLAARYTWTETTERSAVQIMTIHKAKGLEFDMVILPGLGRKPQSDPHRLFLWQEWTEDASQHHLLMAPIQSQTEKDEPIYQFLRKIEKEKQQHEALRLLYVASTRAKQELLLLGTMEEKTQMPVNQSLLSYIWPAIQGTVVIEQSMAESTNVSGGQSAVFYQRIAPSYVKEKSQTVSRWPWIEKAACIENISIEQLKMRAIGTTVHYALWRLVVDQILPETILQNLEHYQILWQERLQELALAQKDLQDALNLVSKAIVQTLKDETGRWILAPRQQSFAEYPLVIKKNDKIQKLILDRMFIEGQICWIIDYKTCLHQDIESVVEQHQGQLANYQQAVQRLYPELEVKSAFYFPLQQFLQRASLKVREER